MTLLETENLRKTYIMGTSVINAVDGISTTVQEGDFISIMGPSGSGKTTFLNLISCIDKPTSGKVIVKSQNVSKLSSSQLDTLRLKYFGFVFQKINLLPVLSAIENVELPMEISGTKSKERKNNAEHLLEMVGLKNRMHHLPIQLSAGEQQRVGIARALANNPVILLADEPTGNLDSKTSTEIVEILLLLNNQQKQTIIMVTHDNKIGQYAKTGLNIVDGKIVS